MLTQRMLYILSGEKQNIRCFLARVSKSATFDAGGDAVTVLGLATYDSGDGAVIP